MGRARSEIHLQRVKPARMAIHREDDAAFVHENIIDLTASAGVPFGVGGTNVATSFG